MYASCIIVQVSLSLLGTTPNTIKAVPRILWTIQNNREISATPRDIQEESRTVIESQYIHLDCVTQVHSVTLDVGDLDLNNSQAQYPSQLVEETEQCIQKSRKERKAFNERQEVLSRTRSGRMLAKLLSNKQRNYLQTIPKDMISKYLINRK